MDTKQPRKIKSITTQSPDTTATFHIRAIGHFCSSHVFACSLTARKVCAMQIFRSWLIIWAQSKGEVVWRVSSIQSTCLGTWRSYQKGSLSLWGSGGSSGACVDGTGNTAGWETTLAYLSDLSMLCSLSYPTCGTNSLSFCTPKALSQRLIFPPLKTFFPTPQHLLAPLKHPTLGLHTRLSGSVS